MRVRAQKVSVFLLWKGILVSLIISFFPYFSSVLDGHERLSRLFLGEGNSG